MMNNIIPTIKAAWPVLWPAITTGQLLNPQCDLLPPDPDVEALYDVPIPLSDGGTTLTCNGFLSKSISERDESSPVIMCAHPYDNSMLPALNKTPFGGPPQQYRLIPQAGGARPSFSPP